MNGPNGPYEKEQGRLMQLYDDLSDDDEEQDPYHDSDASDPDYVPSETSDTDEPVVGLRRFPSEEFLINLSSSDLENDYQSPPLSDAEPEDLDLHRDDDGDRTIPEEPDLWEDTTKPIPVFDFDEDSVGLKINIDENSSPLDVFTSLFTPQIWEYLVQCSNNYAVFLTSTNRPKTRNCRTATIRPITVDELKAFFGLCLLQGQVSTCNVRRFFSFKDVLYYHPVFPFVMSARRFEQILRILCGSAPNLKGKKKVETLIDMFRYQFQAAYVPTKELSLDESLLHFRGRLGFRVYIKNKKDRYGIKFYQLATSDGYVLNLEMYTGQDAKNNGGNQGGANSTTENLVLRLMEPYLQKGYELFMDNYYNSVTLSEKLLELKTHSNGTLRSNRRGNPKDLVKRKLKRGQHFWVRKRNVYVSKWKDKRDVLMITTRNHPGIITVRNKYGQEKLKPREVASYNDHMSGVDRGDQMTATYNTTRKTIRWYKKIILYLLDLTTWNSFYLYKKYCKRGSRKCRFLEFRDDLIKSLIKLPENADVFRKKMHHSRHRHHEQDENENVAETQGGHWPEKIPGTPGEKSTKKSVFLKCRMCSKKKIRRETSFRCKGCTEKPPLCALCFEEWHTQKQ